MSNNKAPWEEDEEQMKSWLLKATGVEPTARFHDVYAELKTIRAWIKEMAASVTDIDLLERLVLRSASLSVFCEDRIAAVWKIIEAERTRITR